MSRFLIRALPSGYKFDLKAPNGQVIATSELYETAAACRKGAESVRKNAPAAKVEDQTEAGWTRQSNPKYQLFQDRAGQFRFRLTATNGKVIAVSEGYGAKSACENGIDSVKTSAPTAEVAEE